MAIELNPLDQFGLNGKSLDVCQKKQTLGSIKVLLKALIKTTVVQNWDDFWSVFSWVAGQNHYQGVPQIKKMGKPLLVRKVAQLPISHQKWSFRAQGFGPWGNLGHMLKLHMMMTIIILMTKQHDRDPYHRGFKCLFDIWKLTNEHSFSFKFIGTIFAC